MTERDALLLGENNLGKSEWCNGGDQKWNENQNVADTPCGAVILSAQHPLRPCIRQAHIRFPGPAPSNRHAPFLDRELRHVLTPIHDHPLSRKNGILRRDS